MKPLPSGFSSNEPQTRYSESFTPLSLSPFFCWSLTDGRSPFSINAPPPIFLTSDLLTWPDSIATRRSDLAWAVPRLCSNAQSEFSLTKHYQTPSSVSADGEPPNRCLVVRFAAAHSQPPGVGSVTTYPLDRARFRYAAASL